MRLRSALQAWGLSLLGLFVFVAVARELSGAEVEALDRAVLLAFGRLRRPWLSSAAVDLTALGSATVVGLVTAVGALSAWLGRARAFALQLLAVVLGATALALLAKVQIERPRPEVISRLVTAEGFSYPSGHTVSAAALYLFLGWSAALRAPTLSSRVFLLAAAVGVACAVGASRVYLGVHFPSDVLGALGLGFAWSLFVIGAGGLLARRALEARSGAGRGWR